MVRQFHDDMQARVQNDKEYSEPFPVTNRVKQDCFIGTNPVQHDVSGMLFRTVMLIFLSGSALMAN